MLEGQPLGVINAGNGAWILGAVPLGAETTKLNLIVGATDSYGQTLVGNQEIATVKPDSVMAPLEVPQEIFELYSAENLEAEARTLGPAMLRSLEINEALWDEPFNAPVSGDVIRRFGQRIVHGMLRPAHPLGGVNVAAESGAPVLATNAGRVALVEDLPIRGKTVALIHGGGVVSVYGHLSETTVQAGDTVTRGQPIGIGRSKRRGPPTNAALGNAYRRYRQRSAVLAGPDAARQIGRLTPVPCSTGKSDHRHRLGPRPAGQRTR